MDQKELQVDRSQMMQLFNQLSEAKSRGQNVFILDRVDIDTVLNALEIAGEM
jgi:hypothetical protein